MNKKTLKRKLNSMFAIVVCAVIVAECFPLPGFIQKVYAGASVDFISVAGGFSSNNLNVGDIVTGDEYIVTVDTSSSSYVDTIIVTPGENIIDVEMDNTSAPNKIELTLDTNKESYGSYTAEVTFRDHSVESPDSPGASLVINYNIIADSHTDSFSLSQTSLSYGQHVGYQYNTNRDKSDLQLMFEVGGDGSPYGTTYEADEFAAYVPSIGDYTVKLKVFSKSQDTLKWESDALSFSVGKGEAKLTLGKSTVYEGDTTTVTVSYKDPTTGNNVTVDSSKYTVKYFSGDTELSEFPSTKGEYSVSASWNTDSLKSMYNSPSATLKVVKKESPTPSPEPEKEPEKTEEKIQVTVSQNTPKTKKDTTKPVIVGVSDKETKYSDEITVKVTDEELEEVIVNGTAQKITNNECSLVLSANLNKQKYTLTASDKSKNTIKIEFVVAEEWTKTGIIPENKKVRLIKGEKVSFAKGKWNITNDSVTYTGGMSVYPLEDMVITATKAKE